MTAQPIGQNGARDYSHEMNDYIDNNMPDGDVVLSDHAESVVQRLLKRDPDLLYGWLLRNAAILLGDYMGTRLRSQRNRSSRNAVARAFRAGDAAAVRATPFDTERFVVDKNNTWRPLGEMTGADHRFVASNYTKQSKEAAMRAAFHRAVAKRVGTKKTAEVLSVDGYESLWRKMMGEDAS